MQMKKLLIFDLDETLVHAVAEPFAHTADFAWQEHHVYVRPHLQTLLQETSACYEFAVWSSASRAYVDAVIAHLFRPPFDLRFAWSVERCVQRIHPQTNGYVYIKDLRKVQSQGYALEQILIVDDSPEKVMRQPKNLVAIQAFQGQQDEKALLQLADDLLARAC